MRQFLLACSAFLILHVASCKKVANTYNPLEVECGVSAERIPTKGFLLKVFDQKNLQIMPQNLLLKDKQGRVFSRYESTPDGCLIFGNPPQNLNVVAPARGEAATIKASDDRVRVVNLKSVGSIEIYPQCSPGTPIYDIGSSITVNLNSSGFTEGSILSYSFLAEGGQTSDKVGKYQIPISSESNELKIALGDLKDSLAEGEYVLDIRLHSLLGDIIRPDEEFRCRVIVDRTPPKVTLDRTLPSRFPVGGRYSILGTFNENIRWFYRLSKKDAEANSPYSLYQGQIELNVPGTYILSYYAVDQAGNKSEELSLEIEVVEDNSVTFDTIHRKPGDVVPLNTIYGTQLLLCINRDEKQCQGGEKYHSPFEGSSLFLPIWEGEVFVSYFAIDRFGNKWKGYKGKYILDETGPKIEIDAASEVMLGQPIDITIDDSSPIQTAECILEGLVIPGPGCIIEDKKRLILNIEGEIAFLVRATDSMGNETIEKFIQLVDGTAPSTTLDMPKSFWTIGEEVRLITSEPSTTYYTWSDTDPNLDDYRDCGICEKGKNCSYKEASKDKPILEKSSQHMVYCSVDAAGNRSDVYKFHFEPSFINLRQLGTPNQDRIGSLKTDSKGDYYLSGETNGSFTNPQLSQNNRYDIWVAKVSGITGELLWLKQRSLNGSSKSISMELSEDGHIFLLYGSATQSTHYLEKIAVDGELQWTKEFKGDPMNMAISSSKIGIIGKHFIALHSTEDGETIWRHTSVSRALYDYGEAEPVHLSSINLIEDQKVLIIGKGGYSNQIVAISAPLDGGALEFKSFRDPVEAPLIISKSIIKLEDNSIFLLWNHEGYIELEKWSLDFSKQFWEAQWRNISYESMTLVLAKDGNIFFGGSFQVDTSLSKTQLMKCSSESGEIMWSDSFSSRFRTILYTLENLRDDRLLLGGSTHGPLLPDVHKGKSDYFFAEYLLDSN